MPLNVTRLATPALGALLLLSACEEEADQAARTSEQGGKAAGEVLGGTISDEMLPLERLRSQSPPLEPGPDEGGDAAPGDEAGAEAEGGAEEGDEPLPAAPAPRPAPAPTSTGLPVAPPVDD